MKKRFQTGFTLIELLVVIAIIALMASMMFPESMKMIDRARSETCMGNLRAIGQAVTAYYGDNQGTFPFIDPDAQNPIYPTNSNFSATNILARLQPYGITTNTLHCPSDKGPPVEAMVYYTSPQYQSSYQWYPIIDGETTVDPQILRHGGARNVRLSHTRICLDYESVHFNHHNWLYADGHVRAQLTSADTTASQHR